MYGGKAILQGHGRRAKPYRDPSSCGVLWTTTPGSTGSEIPRPRHGGWHPATIPLAQSILTDS